MRHWLIGFMGLLAAAGPVAAQAPVAGGAAVSCIPIRNIRSTTVIDDRTVDFHMNGRQVLRNNLPMRCPLLGFEKAFAYQTSIGQLCSVDIITVIMQGGGISRGASCGLGKFTPVEPAAGK